MTDRNLPRIKNLTAQLASMPKEHVCSDQTDLVIEGYPRSANTFVWDMIKVISDRMGRQMPTIAHHTHHFRNVALGIELDKPIFILIRDPYDAIPSRIIYGGRDGDLPIEIATRTYVTFYEYCAKVRDSFELLPFPMVTGDFAAVVQKLNAHLAEPLDMPIEDDFRAAQELPRKRAADRGKTDQEIVRQLAVPLEERTVMKAQLKETVRQYLDEHPRAVELYKEITAAP